VDLRLTEIFYSLQGEARTVGRPTVFVRLTGCPQRCVWCDTEYAFSGGEKWSLEAIVEQVASYQAHYVTVTGGEPLAQPNCLPLLTALCDRGLDVSLETGGAMDIADVDPRVSVVMDLKAPGSGEQHNNRLENIPLLQPHHQVKFVLADRKDYDWARFMLDQHQLHQRVSDVLFSPVQGQLPPGELADWIVADRLPVRFQLQLHKLLWNDARGR
jgi:7-carboxy-7-deazaguanine synthase